MDPALREGYETSRRMLRRHDPTYYFATRRLPRRAASRHARAVRLRAHGRRARRRPAPAADAGRPPRGAGRVGGRAARAAGPRTRRARAGRRRRAPRAAARRAARLHALDAASTARRCGSRSWEELVAYMDGSAGSVGRIMAALLGVPARHHADLGRLGLAFQLANFIRDVREDRAAGPRLPARRGPRALRRRARPTSPRAAAAAVRALLAHEVARARALFAARPAGGRRRAGLGAPRHPLRHRRSTAACSTASRRRLRRPRPRAGVRVWHLPGAALEALR